MTLTKKLIISLLTTFIGCLAAGAANNKPALMWIDGEANFRRFSNADSIEYYIDKIASLGFTHAVVDVRPITGHVLYPSDIAPLENGFNAPFDYLQQFIDAGHRHGIKVLASINVFCAGHNYHDSGLIYSEHPEWASMVYDPRHGIIPITQQKHKYGGMVNPAHPQYQQYIIALMKEIASRYPALDGLMLDRARYDGIQADFSPLSRSLFEKYIGETVANFPDDILTWKKSGGRNHTAVPGKWFGKWIEWRATVIHDFFAEARKAVKAVNPALAFGTYTGAWYPSYYEVGVNFASATYDPSKQYPSWATPTYKNTGLAELFDIYATGNYYTDIRLRDYHGSKVWNETDSQASQGSWYCVEGSNINLRTIMGDKPFLGGVLVSQFYKCPQKLSEAIAENLRSSDGLMVFDIVHIITHNLWNEISKGMNQTKAQ